MHMMQHIHIFLLASILYSTQQTQIQISIICHYASHNKVDISENYYYLTSCTGVSKLDLAVAQVTAAVAPCSARRAASFITKNEK